MYQLSICGFLGYIYDTHARARRVFLSSPRPEAVLPAFLAKLLVILLMLLKQRIQDESIVWLLECIIKSFTIDYKLMATSYLVGLPLGNLTSQLLVNIYMNEFDQYVKHGLRAVYYIRYADDFVFLSESREYLVGVCQKSEAFLTHELKLTLHPDKVSIVTYASGVDFLGFVHFPHHRVLRTVTKKRMRSNTKK